ncbi:MAG TPA: ABC transporter ATP-binding protein [Rhodanobacteraceae bacterium]|jgi:ABC-type multidrug transport system fused ATPase/permease subunit|nr:ABC transporter ATP-binding protein [Rhodanobacteraceae bacterium]
MKAGTTTATSAPTAVAATQAPGYGFLLGLLRPYRWALGATLVLMLAQSALALVNPWLAGRFTFALLHHRSVLDLLLGWFAVIVVQGVLGYLVSVRMATITQDLIANLGTRAFDHLQSLPLAWHQGRRHGDVLSLLTRDVEQLGNFVTHSLTPLLPLLLTCVGALLLMLRIEPWFALGAAVLLPAMFIGMRLAGRRLRPLGNEMIQAYASKHALAEQSLAMLPVVKAFTREPEDSSQFATQTRGLRDLNVTLARANALIGPTVRVVAAAAVLAMLWLASREVASGRLAIDGLVSLLFYGLLLIQPISSLAGLYGSVHTAMGGAQRLLAAFREQPEPADGDFAPEAVRGDIVFEGVRFAYPGRPPLFEQLDLHLHAGETVAITGVNGAGKSTLAHLLMRFIDPDAGSIRLDGHDLREFKLRALRGHIGVVPQNVLLFNGSVEANIAFGRRDASHAEIEAAARLARAHEFVVELPDGYDTEIGDRGIRLSGGQRQRIALARALLKDPSVLVLDEATAMFDPDAEGAFVAACHDMLRSRSVLLITHRPASLAIADRVLRLEDGKLREVSRALA